ncbi:DMT family transporter [Bacillus massiliigorillae]|uniref:DMT family transporter n=1 Tax=Bacillus massiliigorillae TaxID=1243664 RepID=UPI0005A6725B|nr:multidrug resistance efflux transporter family protein [Bacillus massiliigorillae]
MRPIILGACSAFFFAFTFIINRAMELNGGSWLWSASLRYFFMVIFLLIIVGARKNLHILFHEMKKAPTSWIIWSTVGFGLFYAPLTYASSFAPGWLIAGTWQITIISGSLLAPLFMEKVQLKSGETVMKRGSIPWRGLGFSTLILLGVIVMQFEHASVMSLKAIILCSVSMIIASFAYPLGNRKMMNVCGDRLDAYQRTLGMTIASLPLWIILSIIGMFTVGAPSSSQVVQSGLVALFSGVAATVLFFAATNLVKNDMEKLGAVEATQSLEVLFAVAGEILFLASPIPSLVSWIGMALVMVGMALHSYMSHRTTKSTYSAKQSAQLND